MRTVIALAGLLLGTACAGATGPATLGLGTASSSSPSPVVDLTLPPRITTPIAPASQSPTGSPAPSATPQHMQVTLTDALRIEPNRFSLSVGQTITFVITNGGGMVHEFFVGDAAAQAEREAELVASGGDAPEDTPTGRAIAPGQTEELTYVFTQPGAWMAGCHVTNHYVGGMKAEIDVSAP